MNYRTKEASYFAFPTPLRRVSIAPDDRPPDFPMSSKGAKRSRRVSGEAPAAGAEGDARGGGAASSASAAAPPTALYTGERLAFEFQRTASRLIEMQSHDYLARPHQP
jgi:hypothetical protein